MFTVCLSPVPYITCTLLMDPEAQRATETPVMPSDCVLHDQFDVQMTNRLLQADAGQVVLVMVGLPARGKSLIAGKGMQSMKQRVPIMLTQRTVVRYLQWTSVRAEIFNVGKYRREGTPHPDAKFFDAGNPEGEKARRAAAEAAVADMLNWLKNPANKVAILDATNSTKSRRKWIYEKLEEEPQRLELVSEQQAQRRQRTRAEDGRARDAR